MRIIATSDLHYNIARSKAPTEAIARRICERGGDILLLVGDTAGVDLAILEQALGLFEAWSGPKLLTAGNHELWTAPGEDSLDRYERRIGEACARQGFHYLDAEPFSVDGIAVVGSVGWYDYSFRPSAMGIPLRFYQHKVAPGAAGYFEEHRHLLAEDGAVPEAAMQVTSRWMDGRRVRLPMSDVAFTGFLVNRLRLHLEQVPAPKVLAAIHHLPFAELVPHSTIPDWEFATGFLGSEMIGETLLAFPNVRRVVCGHSHRSARMRRGALECSSIGSTYREKQFETIDL